MSGEQKVSRRKFLKAGAGAVIAAAVVGIGAYEYLVTRPAPKEEVTVKVAYFRVTASLMIWAAQDKGFFEKNDVKVALEELPDAGAIIEALAAGKVDVGSTMAPLQYLGLADKTGFYLKVLHPANMVGTYKGAKYGPQSFIVVKKDSPIRDMPDLKGRIIAVQAFGTGNHIVLKQQLKNAGLDPDKEVKIVQIPLPQMEGAIATGQIDAAVTFYPFVSIGVDRGTFRILRANIEDVIPETIISMCGVHPDFAQKYPDTTKRMLRALGDAAEWIMDPANAAARKALVSKWAKLPPDLVEKIPLTGEYFKPYPEGISAKEIREFFEPVMKLLLEWKVVSKSLELEKFALRS